MAVSLREITRENFEAIIDLKVREDQDHVASNVYSIAQSKVFTGDLPYAIYNDETPVGFIMYNINDDVPNGIWISRLMIDAKFQGKGFGTATLSLIRDIAINKKFDRIKLSTDLTNIDGIAFYSKFGFVDTGVIQEDEEVFEYKITY